jgi:Chaperone of endosialidase
MTSQIDPTAPVYGTPTTASVRANFQTAHNEISALQLQVPLASNTAPIMDGIATVGTGTTWARADHVHPSDTSRYAASNPAGYQTAAQLAAAVAGYLPLAGGTMSGGITMTGGTGIAYAPDTSRTGIGFRWDPPSRFLFCDINGGGIGPIIYSYAGTDWVGVQSIAVHVGGDYAVANFNGGSVSWPTNYSSDARLKTNMVPCDVDALVLTNRLPVWSGDYIAPMPGAVTQHHDCMFLAQEVEPVVPNAYLPPPDADGFASLSPLPLVATLWRAVQQLADLVDAQGARIAALEGKA